MSSKKDKTIRQVFRLSDTNQLQLPLFHSHDFFFSGNDSDIPKTDLTQHLVKNPDATFLLRMSEPLDNEEIARKGDILLMDRSVIPTENSLVLIMDNETLTVKQIVKKNNAYYLKSFVKNTPLLAVKEEMNIEIIGVITSVIRQY